MKGKALKTLFIFSLIPVLFVAGTLVFAHSGNRVTNQDLEETSGRVAFRTPGGYFLSTASGKEYKLVMGPVWHLEEMGLELKNNDQISVKGYEIDEDVFFVSSVKKGAKTYDLSEEDESGYSSYGPGSRMWEDMTHRRGFHGRGWRGNRRWNNGGHCW
jgi:hypothetical protein